ncbi:MAG: methyltransferase domain-containing protein [Caldilineaceae bacterium]|nr:methyltransferase domain-containing protein [Caldilineaceae bacterium]
MEKSLVQQQFGAHAATYVTSVTHAKGASLARLVELTTPQPDWTVLDVATGAGHTAFAFAPLVRQVWATDVTREMLQVTAEQAAQRGLQNLVVEYAEAERLPYADASFDLVTCRIAPHHFEDIHAFVRSVARVLKPGGLFALVDNIVPDGAAGDYINAFEKFRDPSHGRCLSMEEWRTVIQSHGLITVREEMLQKRVDLAAWAARHDSLMRRYLRALLSEATGPAAVFLAPDFDGEAASFRLWEGLFVSRRGEA